jgi:hypothetical protein
MFNGYMEIWRQIICMYILNVGDGEDNITVLVLAKYI